MQRMDTITSACPMKLPMLMISPNKIQLDAQPASAVKLATDHCLGLWRRTLSIYKLLFFLGAEFFMSQRQSEKEKPSKPRDLELLRHWFDAHKPPSTSQSCSAQAASRQG